MKLRAPGIALTLGAAALYFGVVPAATSRAVAARSDARALQQKLSALSERLGDLERYQRARRRAVEAASAPVSQDTLAEFRRGVISALSESQLHGVQLSVGKGPTGATVSLSAIGSQTEVLRLIDRLAHPRGILILESVALRPRGDSDVTLSLAGFGLAGES
jgi:hypothetical protein